MLRDIPLNVILMQLFFGLALGSIFVIMASGLSIIYGLLDVVNFAHGVFAMLGAYVVFFAVSLSGNFAVGIVSAVVIVALIGAVVEFVLLKPLYGKDPLLPLLLTFGLAVAIPDVVKIAFGLIGKAVAYPAAFSGATKIGPLILSNYRMFIIVFTLAVLISLWIFLKKSDLGMIIRAATQDSLMVQVLGHQHLPDLDDRICPGRRPCGAGGCDRRPDDVRDTGHGGGDDHGGLRRDGCRRAGEPGGRNRRGAPDRGHRRLHGAGCGRIFQRRHVLLHGGHPSDTTARAFRGERKRIERG